MSALTYGSDGSASVAAARRPVAMLGAIKRALRRRAVYRELMSLDDRLLADIGLNRAGVAAAADRASAEAAPVPVHSSSVFGLVLRAISQSLGEALRRRAARAELMALDDRLLADIGLSRGQIEAALGGASLWTALRGDVDAVLLRPLLVWQRGREAARTLNTLDDRQLADVGMLRAEIGWVAAELAERSLKPANTDGLKRAA